MSHREHRKEDIAFTAVTVSSSRDKGTDKSGPLMSELVENWDYHILKQVIISDDPDEIVKTIQAAVDSKSRIVILSGGTGLSLRDNTADCLEGLLEKQLPGFGELFRHLSYQAIGERALLSRAVGGLVGDTLVFALPGAPDAVRLGLEELILPVAGHAIYEIDKERKPNEG